MTTEQNLPPLPEPDGQMTVTFGIDEKRKVPVFFGCKLTDYALAALAQQAQGEPVAWLMRAIGTSQFEFARPNQKAMHPHMWTDAFPVYRTTPQPAPQVPAPVHEREAFERYMTDNGKWHQAVQRYDNEPKGYVLLQTANAWAVWQARAALQSPAPQATKGGEA